MPELPEVETVRRGIAPHLTGQIVTQVVVRQPQLRWPVPEELAIRLPGQMIRRVERRAKYLLLRTDAGTAILHLGMTGRLRILPTDTPLQKHDHVDLALADGYCLRFNDSRRFGAPTAADSARCCGPRNRRNAIRCCEPWGRSRSTPPFPAPIFISGRKAEGPQSKPS